MRSMDFSDFIKIYPKQADPDARKCFARLSEKDQLSAIAGAERYSRLVICAGTDWHHILNPSTFINRRRWEEALPALETVLGE